MKVVGAYAAKTDTGKKRRRNEDAFVLAPPLFAVADGMGGAQAGEIASKLAAAALEDTDPGRLTGPENIFAFRTERYPDHPLLVAGPGAGPQVTAAGAFADILRVARALALSGSGGRM